MDEKKIKSKYKQCLYQHLKKIYTKNLNVLPSNCKYNKQIRLPNKSVINICTFNLEDTFDLDLCYKIEHAKECNAFCNKNTKESLYIQFIKEIQNDQVRSTKYKDIHTLFWVYPELEYEEFPKKRNILAKIYSDIKTFLKKYLK